MKQGHLVGLHSLVYDKSYEAKTSIQDLNQQALLHFKSFLSISTAGTLIWGTNKNEDKQKEWLGEIKK